jgi:hypothetical protein
MEAWIATDKNGETFMYEEKPERNDKYGVWESWLGTTLPGDPHEVGLESYPKWEDGPVKVKLTFSNLTENGRMNQSK